MHKDDSNAEQGISLKLAANSKTVACGVCVCVCVWVSCSCGGRTGLSAYWSTQPSTTMADRTYCPSIE